jgi:hypothetical protein
MRPSTPVALVWALVPKHDRSTDLHRNPPACGISRNGASRTRTGDLLGAIQALSQLSYSPRCFRTQAMLKSVVVERVS